MSHGEKPGVPCTYSGQCGFGMIADSRRTWWRTEHTKINPARAEIFVAPYSAPRTSTLAERRHGPANTCRTVWVDRRAHLVGAFPASSGGGLRRRTEGSRHLKRGGVGQGLVLRSEDQPHLRRDGRADSSVRKILRAAPRGTAQGSLSSLPLPGPKVRKAGVKICTGPTFWVGLPPGLTFFFSLAEMGNEAIALVMQNALKRLVPWQNLGLSRRGVFFREDFRGRDAL